MVSVLVFLLLTAGSIAWSTDAFDLGPLDVGLKVLRLSTRDLRVKPEFMDDQIGEGALRLRVVTDGLRAAIPSAAHAREIGSVLAATNLQRSVEFLLNLLDEGQVSIEPPTLPLDEQAPLVNALTDLTAQGLTTTVTVGSDVNRLPPEVQRAVAVLLYGIAQANTLLTSTLRNLSPEDATLVRETLPAILVEERPSTRGATLKCLRTVAQLDLSNIVSATATLTGTVCAAREHLSHFEPVLPDNAPETTSTPLFTCKTEFGPVIICGTGNDIHTITPALLIDLGGNDRYEINSPEEDDSPPISIVLDLSGDDLYTFSTSFGPSATLLGLSMLVDEEGNDIYTARSPYAFGAALCGSGILVDAAGNDQYLGVVFGEGAAMFGLGLLFDENGDDIYQGGLYAQGFGSTKGVGALIDHSGKDTYRAGQTYPLTQKGTERWLACSQGFGLGLRGAGTPGGLGLLIESEGDDLYIADTYCQGSARWFGAGLLFEQKGDDQYEGGEYAQGAGTFLAIAYLLDEGGNDRYNATQYAQGFGRDHGIGILRDAEGSDSYTASRMAQGAALASGIGLSVDLTGADVYMVRHEGEGFVPPGESLATVALFADGAGNDTYAGPHHDNLCWSQRGLGLGIDQEGNDFASLRADLPITAGRGILPPIRSPLTRTLLPIPGDVPVDVDLDALWTQATQSEDPTARTEAIRMLVRLREHGAEYLAPKLADPNEMTAQVAQETLALMGSPAVPALLKVMEEGSEAEAHAAMSVLSRISDPRASGHLLREAASPLWRRRAAAAGGMGAQLGEDTRKALERLLRDEDEDVRRSAIVALRRRGEKASAEAISGLLGDPIFAVRFAAADALVHLVALGARCPSHTFSLVGSGRAEERHLSIETCGLLGSRQSLQMLIGLLDSPDWADRLFAAEAVCRIGDNSACPALQAALEKEENGLVKTKTQAMIRATRLCEPFGSR
ncbi:MAG: HEAT repeat domain-containing protein [Candidatus Zipacnadales bacterium]